MDGGRHVIQMDFGMGEAMRRQSRGNQDWFLSRFPPEVRCKIYKEYLREGGSPHHLLRTCRFVYEESEPIVLNFAVFELVFSELELGCDVRGLMKDIENRKTLNSIQNIYVELHMPWSMYGGGIIPVSYGTKPRAIEDEHNIFRAFSATGIKRN